MVEVPGIWRVESTREVVDGETGGIGGISVEVGKICFKLARRVGGRVGSRKTGDLGLDKERLERKSSSDLDTAREEMGEVGHGKG